MPKVKPSWVCQHCLRPFTTKYSLMRHFKRFPQHAPPNLHDGANLKPITITIDETENVRTVQLVPAPPVGTATATPHQHGTRKKQTLHSNHHKRGKHQKNNKYSSNSSSLHGLLRYPGAPPMTTTTNAASASSSLFQRQTTMLQSHHDLPVVEETPSPNSCETPMTSSSTHNHYITNNALFNDPPSNGQFPFLPPFLEEDQILDIATPQMSHQQQQQQQQQSSTLPNGTSSEVSSEASSSCCCVAAEPQSPLAAHYSWIFSKDTTTAEPGSDLLSPLAPACNYEQVFSDKEEEKLQQQLLAKKQQHFHGKPRSPIELAALDNSLLLGDEEATSPFTFMEKTSSSLLISDPILPVAAASSSNRRESANVSLEDLDFGFTF